MYDDISDQLYHVLVRTSSLEKNPHNVLEKIQITGTYTSVQAAKEAAHNVLFSAGYERDWFELYEVRASALETFNCKGLMVLATTPGGTTFRVCLDTTLNGSKLKSELEDGRVTVPLYYVVQENVEYNSAGGSAVPEVNVEGVFRSYEEARGCARKVLLSEEDAVGKESYEEYEEFVEASPDEEDCEYGENVIVRAVSVAGMNYAVSVLRSKALGSVRVEEAAAQI